MIIYVEMSECSWLKIPLIQTFITLILVCTFDCALICEIILSMNYEELLPFPLIF